jgi:hypothetical protein
MFSKLARYAFRLCWSLLGTVKQDNGQILIPVHVSNLSPYNGWQSDPTGSMGLWRYVRQCFVYLPEVQF